MAPSSKRTTRVPYFARRYSRRTSTTDHREATAQVGEEPLRAEV